MTAREPSGRAGSRETRRRVLDAVLRLIARRGLHAVTYRAVAAEARAPLGVVSYHFPSRRALFAAAYALHLERTRERARVLRRTRRGPPTARAVAGEILAFVEGRSEQDRESLVADFELMLETTRDPRLEAELAAARAETMDLAAELVAAAGSAKPRDDARLVIALVQGLALERFAQPRNRELRESLPRLARRFVEKLLG